MLEISEPYKTILADELALIREKMDSDPDPRKKNFYYSAAYAMVQRVFNLDPESDQQLVFIHTVLASSYNLIKDCVNNMVAGDRLITQKFHNALYIQYYYSYHSPFLYGIFCPIYLF